MPLKVGDIEGDLPSSKRIRRSSSDALQDMANDDELSLYGSDLNNAQSSQVNPFLHFQLKLICFLVINTVTH